MEVEIEVYLQIQCPFPVRFSKVSISLNHQVSLFVGFMLFIKPPDKRASSINRGSYMSAHVLLNLLNELGKRDKMGGLPSILSLFCNEFNKFNNTRARTLDSIYHMTLR